MSLLALATRHSSVLSLGGLAALVLFMFDDVLFFGGTRVLGARDTDLFLQFVSWREFGFAELAKGNIALWNPHIYGGAPYFGGMQAALLYPVNWLFLLLPTAAAFNWTIAINVWLLGTFMWLWCRCRGLAPLSAFTAATLLMFAGPHFLHIHAGHVTNLPAMTWAPLIFLAIDKWLDSRRSEWLLLGMVAVCMQILAGHPQYVFYTAITSGIYALLRLARSNWVVQGAGLAAIYVGGALLSAVQLLPGIQAAKETVRDAPLPWEFASMFGFPPENLVTLLAPGFFGNMTTFPYWGRCYLWEMCLFFGVVGLALAVHGSVRGHVPGKRAILVTLGITLLIAFGRNTPLFRLLYDFVPGFDRFRSVSKFNFQTILFATLLAGVGLDDVLRKGTTRSFPITTAVAAAAALVTWGILCGRPWSGTLRAMAATSECYLPPQAYESAEFAAQAGSVAATSIALAGFVLAVLTAVLCFAPRAPRLTAPTLALLAVAEVFLVASRYRPTFDCTTVVNPELKQFLASKPGDYRILNPLNHNSAMSMGAYDLWGFDPGAVRRYAEFVTWTQGDDPAQATQYVAFKKLTPSLAMLRLKYALTSTKKGVQLVEAETRPLPQALLVYDYEIARGRDAVFAALGKDDFCPTERVILEDEPSPKPEPGPEADAGTVNIVRQGTDELEIEADLRKPAILLVTDCWTPSWRAVSLQGSSQSQYDVLPADYTLRGIPLSAGRHVIRLEYAPWGYRVGAWVSLFAWGAWAMTAALVRHRQRIIDVQANG